LGQQTEHSLTARINELWESVTSHFKFNVSLGFKANFYFYFTDVPRVPNVTFSCSSILEALKPEVKRFFCTEKRISVLSDYVYSTLPHVSRNGNKKQERRNTHGSNQKRISLTNQFIFNRNQR
jgi:hypothetical protein